MASTLAAASLSTILVTGCAGPAVTKPSPGPAQAAVPSPVIQAVPSPRATLAPTTTPTTPTSPPAVPSENSTGDSYVAGTIQRSAVDGMEQAYIPAGEFLMGSEDPDARQALDGGVAAPEVPVHPVYLEAYWMDRFEVTNGQYELCVQAGACAPHFAPISATRLLYYGQAEFDDYPVIYVNWSEAQAYCTWAGRRLPSEAEWEKAARGTDGREFPWGDEPVDGTRANFCDVGCPRTYANKMQDDGYPDTAPVGSFPAGASPYGVMDMAGNVWEWTGTLLAPYPYDLDDGREDPDADGQRVWRGGPWSNGWWWMRASLRYHSVSWYRHDNLGFRCAAPATGPE